MTRKQVNRSAIRGSNPNPRTRPYYHRMCKRGNSNSIDSLPDDLLSEILLRFPVEFIRENARFVCKRWKRIIDGDAFVYAHLHRTNHGLLVTMYVPKLPYRPKFVTATEGGVEISVLSYKFGYSITGSCNGLILGTEVNRKQPSLYIVNPETKMRFNLPRSFNKELPCQYVIGYAAASMEYKVVASYLEHCNILTVGVDATWRNLATRPLTLEAKWHFHRDPLITEGFMHWACWSGNDVLTMNVETEVFAETPAPLALLEYGVEGFKYSYMSTGRHLSLLFSCGELLWEVWGMEGESGEWRKLLPNIDLKAHKSEIQQLISEDDISLVPTGWVKYPVVLLFALPDMYGGLSYMIYNLDNDEIDSIDLPCPKNTYGGLGVDPVVHKNSLVCLS